MSSRQQIENIHKIATGILFEISVFKILVFAENMVCVGLQISLFRF